MKKFAEIYQEIEVEIEVEIKEYKNKCIEEKKDIDGSDIVKIFEKQIEHFIAQANENNHYSHQLTKAQSNIAHSILRIIKNSFDIFSAIKPPKFLIESSEDDDAKLFLSEILEKIQKILKIKRPKWKVDRVSLHDYLQEAFEEIDYALEAQDAIFKELLPKLTFEEECKDILEFLQELMGEAIIEDSPLFSPRMQRQMKGRIPTVLRHHKIKVLIYPTDTKDLNNIEDYFEFEPSLEPDCQEIVMLKPAFVKNENIILKGLLREPNT